MFSASARIASITITGLVLGSSSVLAADILVTKAPPAPPPASVVSWTNFYVGGHVGYGWAPSTATVDSSLAAVPPPPPPVPTPTPYPCSYAPAPPAPTPAPAPTVVDNLIGDQWSGTARGFLGGGTVGYNHQLASFLVVGLEGDLGYLGINRTLGPSARAQDLLHTDGGFYATARGRIGLAFDRFLVFATGGLAVADLGVWVSDPAHGLSSSKIGTQVGWTVGGGAEFALNQHWSLKVDYLHMDFGSHKVTAQAAPGPTAIPVAWNVDTTVDVIRVGANYRF